MNESMKRILFAIVGSGTLIGTLYIGYIGYLFLQLAWSLSLGPSGLITGLCYSVFWLVISLNLLNITYILLITAITNRSADRQWLIYLHITAMAIIGTMLVSAAFTFAPVLSGYHIGDWVSEENATVKLTGITTTDNLECLDCKELKVGWKYMLVNYELLANNYTWGQNGSWKHLNRIARMSVGDLKDENGVSYSPYLLPIYEGRSDYYLGPETTNDYKSGKIVYKIPIGSVPKKIRLFLNYTPIDFSLHERGLL